MRRVMIALLGLVLVAGVSTGCDSSTPTISPTVQTLAGSLTEYFQKVLDMANPSPDVRQVIERAIASGHLAATDYESAHAAYAQCMAQHGFEPSFRKTPEGYYIELPYTNITDHQALNDADETCSSGFALIDIMYRVQQTNPSLVASQSLQAVQCLRRYGIVDASYSVDDFDRDRGADTFPFDVYQTDANNCLYEAGYAYFNMNG